MRFDLSAMVLLALFLWAGYRRGLLLTAVGFISSLISIAIAFLMVRPLSGWFFKLGLFSESMKDLSDLVHEGSSQYPAGLSAILEGLGMPDNWVRKILQSSDTTGSNLVDSAVLSVWQLVLAAISLMIIFVLVRIGLGLLARLLTPVLNGVPVVAWLNRTGGLVMGFLWGLFSLWVIIMVLTSVSVASPLVRSFMEDSRLLALLAEKDIFRSLLDTIF